MNAIAQSFRQGQITLELSDVPKAPVAKAIPVTKTIIKVVSVYNPYNYQAVLTAAIVAREIPDAVMVRLDKNIPLDADRYIWVGCSPKVVSERLRPNIAAAESIVIEKKEQLEEVHSLKRPLVKRFTDMVNGWFRKDQPNDEYSQLQDFLGLEESGSTECAYTLIDVALVKLGLTKCNMASVYRAASEKFATFGSPYPFWEINCRDIYDQDRSKIIHRDPENRARKEVLYDYLANVYLTSHNLALAEVALKLGTEYEPVLGLYQRDGIDEYKIRMRAAMLAFKDSWCHDEVMNSKRRRVGLIRMNVESTHIHYVIRYLKLSGRLYYNVTTGLSGNVVTANVTIHREQQFNPEVSFVS